MTHPVHALRSGWPLLGVATASLVGLAAGGLGAAVAVGILSILFFGPAYLVQNAVRRRRGTLATPRPQSPEQARADARELRAGAVGTVLAVPALVLIAAAEDLNPLADSGLTPALLIVAGLGAGVPPYLWALAELVESGRVLRWVWALAGALDLAFAVAAAAVAVTNLWRNWVGGHGWTIAFALAALFATISGAADLIRAQAPAASPRPS